VSAAAFIEERAGPGRALYRVHEPPADERLEQLGHALALAGVRLPREDPTPAAIQAALASLAGRANSWLYELLVLRSLTQAVYTPENQGHFGLALSRYMHFTSPIRRYADLVVHRTIKALLHGDEPPYSPEELIVIGGRISGTERRAESVGWGVDAWLKCEYVADRVGETFDGVVMGVTDFGLFVELKGFYVQGLLHVSELGGDYFQYQPQSLALVGERSGRRYRLGDELRVLLADVLPEQGRLDLRLDRVPGGRAGQSRAGPGDSKRERRKSDGRRRGGPRRRERRR
jgi:ribonuclease R